MGNGPDITGVSQTVPAGCAVDQVALVSRHGSRYPDPGAYNEWLALATKVQNGTFSGPLAFLNDWSPPLTHPPDQIAQLSVTGYLETYTLGTQTRLRYPHLYADNTPFVVWANSVQRTTDSARLFARGFGGPNATTLGTVLTVDPKGIQAGGNSLATSDLCPRYVDTSGASQYEYRQDLRYYYGTGPASGLPATLMLPYLNATATLFLNGPGYTYSTGFTPPPIIVSYTHDNQINQIVTALGVFNTTGPLPQIPKSGVYVRVRVNDAVYPLLECQNGPGKMCTLADFGRVIKAKVDQAGDFMTRCGLSSSQTLSNGQTTIFWDTKLPWIKPVQP
ncbi:histidine phosphatase family containing protein [Ceratobasidium sp. AG-Ba]|nr:histidine phosphatase family containing protein [Ceratobasidium sp. AG-Ba]